MTISLHWWMVPCALCLIGIYLTHRANTASGYAGGFMEACAALAFFGMAIAFTVGHFT